jgi:WD40 repeat protein
MKKIILLILLAYPLSIWAQKTTLVFQSGLQREVQMTGISPDNRLILTVEKGEMLILWELRTGKQLQSFEGILSAKFGQDSRSIEVVRKDFSLKTLDFNGKTIPNSPSRNTQINKRGTNVFVDYGKRLLLDNEQFYKGKVTIGGTSYFSQKLNAVIGTAVSSDTKVKLSNAADDSEIKTLDFNLPFMHNDKYVGNSIVIIRCSNDGKYLAASDGYTLEVQEISTGRSVFSNSYKAESEYTKPIYGAEFSPDAKKLLISSEQGVQLIDLATKNVVWKVPALAVGKAIQFSEDGKLVVMGHTALACLNAETGAIVSKISDAPKSYMYYHQLIGDDKLLMVEQDDNVLNWNLATGELQKVMPIETNKQSNNFAINAKGTKFYKYLAEIDAKTLVETPFDEVKNHEGESEQMMLTHDENLVAYQGYYRKFLKSGDIKKVFKFVVSDVQTKKIVWQKEGISYPSFFHKSLQLFTSIVSPETNMTSEILVLDAKTGEEIRKFPLPSPVTEVGRLIISANDAYAAFRVIVEERAVYMILEVATGKITTICKKLPNSEDCLGMTFLNDEKKLLMWDYWGNAFSYNIDNQRFDAEKTLNSTAQNYYNAFALTQNDRFIFTSFRGSNYIQLWDVKTHAIAATLYSNPKTSDWAVVTPDGRFDGTKGMHEKMYFVKGVDVIPLAGMFEKFYTPHLLSRILAGEKFDPSPVKVEDLKGVPTVKIIIENKQRNLVVEDDIPSYTLENEQITLKIQADCPNDVVTEIQLFQNGKLVGSTRNLIVEDDKPNGEKFMVKIFNVTLNNGENRFKAIALNSQRTESQPDEIILNYKAAKAQNAQNTVDGGNPDDGGKGSPTLHLLVIGINKYKNPKYNLNYATADATSFKAAIEKGGTGIFSKTNVVFIGDAQATKEGISNELEKIKTAAMPKDVFIFYYAGHGVLNEKKEFYLVPYDVTQLYGQDEALAQKGLSANQLQQFSKDIKAQKQLFILDACQSAGAIDQIVAARGAAEEKAIAQLARATGTHWLTASGSEQFASEFQQLGHGTFTYVLLEALSGKADKGGDKKITVKELDAYLQEQVPELTAKYKGTPQFPASYGFGNDFPIGVVKN